MKKGRRLNMQDFKIEVAQALKSKIEDLTLEEIVETLEDKTR